MKRIERLYRTAALLLLLMLAAACTRDDGLDDMVPGNAAHPATVPLTITVSDRGYSRLPEASATDAAPDGAPDTRAVDNGYATEFTAGDRIGLYVSEVEVDAHGTPTAFRQMLHKNLCLTYDGTTWTLPAGTELKYNPSDGHGIRYFAYYPYQADMNRKEPDGNNASGSIATEDTEFFYRLIVNWWVKSDQSTYADYTASDLMTAQGVVSTRTDGTAGSTLSFTMQHQMYLAIIRLPHTTYSYQETIGGSTFNKSYSLYTGASSFDPLWKENHYTARCICGLQEKLGIRLYDSFYNSDFEKRQLNTEILITSPPSGKYKLYTIDGGAETVKTDRPLREGDFYMKDGTILPQEAFNNGADIPAEVKADCIGVVFWVGEKDGMHWTQTGDRKGDHLLMHEHPACTHGMVVALQNASELPVAWATNPLNETLWDWANEFSGFTDKEKSLWEMIYKSNTNYGYNYMAYFGLYIAHNKGTDFPAFEAVKTYAGSHSTPEGCSGWFFPNMAELTTIWFNALPGHFAGKPFVFDRINQQIKKAGGAELEGAYWSSYDHNGGKETWAALPNSYGARPQADEYNVRAVLVF